MNPQKPFRLYTLDHDGHNFTGYEYDFWMDAFQMAVRLAASAKHPQYSQNVLVTYMGERFFQVDRGGAQGFMEDWVNALTSDKKNLTFG